jgi:hypothetical protein
MIHVRADHWETDDKGELPEDTCTALRRHPAKLAWHVSSGDDHAIRSYHNKLRTGWEPITVRPMKVQGFTAGCLAKAIERIRTPGIIGPDRISLFEPILPKAEYERQAQALVARDIRPIGVEALAGLVNDFYALTEQLVPEFAAQKELQPQVPPTPPIEY